MATLYLHAGHGKTGSSYIQSTMANSIESVLEQGYYYPFSRDITSAASGKISSGNSSDFERLIDHGVIGEKVIFSGENFFHLFRGESGRELLRKACSAGYDEVNIILFIRDPIDHAPSSYQQSIKRGGQSWDVSEFFGRYSVPKLVDEFIRQCSLFEDINLTVKNYSRCRSNILSEFCSWSGLCESKLMVPKVKNVNRSLTRAELIFQREFNKNLGKCGGLISDVLCNELPDIESELMLPSKEVQERMLERMKGHIDFVNSKVDQQHRYNCTTADVGSEDGDVFLSRD